MSDVRQWLDGLGLGQYADAFEAEPVRLSTLPHLTGTRLKELGLPTEPRARVLAAIKSLSGGESVTELSEAAEQTETAAFSLRSHQPERRQLTVVFCDMVGSTALSERLDPEDLSDVISAYQNACAEVIRRFDGYIARYLGDGLLVYFGYPQAHEDDAERAVRAGLELVRAVGNVRFDDLEVTLRVRVGVATGLVVVGDLVSGGAAQESTVIGETPNLAARLQALAEPGTVVISRQTLRLIDGLFEVSDLGNHELKGFAELVHAWRVIRAAPVKSRFEALRGTHLTPFVGRERQLALLIERWQRAREGGGQVVLLSGEPGIGKSRLVEVVRSRLHEPHTHLRYQCFSLHTNDPLHPVIRQLENAARLGPNDTPKRTSAKLHALLKGATNHLAAVVPLIADLLGNPHVGRDDGGPNLDVKRLLEVLLTLLVDLAARRPLLLVVEDAQWIDPTSLELLERTAERAKDLPILVIITFRPQFRPQWKRSGHMTVLTVDRLNRKDTALLAGNIAGGRKLPPSVLEGILTRTDGVPLFVEELTQAALESVRTGNQGSKDETRNQPFIPATLQAALLSRLDQLGSAKQLAQAAAVIGRDFSRELLSAIVSLPDSWLDEALLALEAAGLINRPATAWDATYVFKHALVRDIAYASLLKRKRRQMHARLVTALEADHCEAERRQPRHEYGLLAYHCTEASLLDKAIRFRRKAATWAASRYAHLEAVAHATQGLGLIKALPDNPERRAEALDLQSVLTQELARLKGYEADETVKAYRRLSQLCQAGENSAQLRRAFQALFGFHLLRFELAPARRAAERLLELAQSQADVADQCNGYYQSGQIDLFIGDLRAARLCMERVGALCADNPTVVGTGGFHDRHLVAACYLSWALFALGYPATALAKCKEAAELASRSYWHDAVGGGMTGWCVLQQLVGNPQSVRDGAKVIVSLVPASNPRYPPRAELFEIWGLAAAGKTDESLDRLRRSRVASHRAVAYSSYYLSLVAQTFALAQQTENALNVVTQALDQLERTGDRWFEAELHRLRGELLLALPNEDANNAEVCFRKALDVSRMQHAKGWELRAASSLARLWQRQGKRREAYALLAPVYAWFTEGFETADLKAANTLLENLK